MRWPHLSRCPSPLKTGLSLCAISCNDFTFSVHIYIQPVSSITIKCFVLCDSTAVFPDERRVAEQLCKKRIVWTSLCRNRRHMGKFYVGSSVPTIRRVSLHPSFNSWERFARNARAGYTLVAAVIVTGLDWHACFLRTGVLYGPEIERDLFMVTKAFCSHLSIWPDLKAVHMCIRLLNRKALGQHGSKLRHPEPRAFLKKVCRSYFLFATYMTGTSSPKKKICQGS